jgi:metallo-beta-lactamase class B
MDHAGGLSALQQASGAELWASEASANAIASGGDDPNMAALPWRALFWIGIGSYPAARAVPVAGIRSFAPPGGRR